MVSSLSDKTVVDCESEWLTHQVSSAQMHEDLVEDEIRNMHMHFGETPHVEAVIFGEYSLLHLRVEWRLYINSEGLVVRAVFSEEHSGSMLEHVIEDNGVLHVVKH